tara:strand:+ start:3659 stop:5077 length:1419 start_codon:yes stop_codon:yes gene_type:complete
MASVDPSKIDDRTKKFIESKLPSSSIATEQEILNADPETRAELIAQNELALSRLAASNSQNPTLVDQFKFIQTPSRASDHFTFNQTPGALMTGVPRQKFEYLATFRFASDNVFQTIFSDAEVEGLDQKLQTNTTISNQNSKASTSNNLNQQRSQVLESIRRSLVFNIKQIDGPKVNFQYDTLNQYNRKRNVYRRVDYDPVSLRFFDTMDNSALKLFRYLYELNLKDGRNRHRDYGGSDMLNKGLYHPNSISTEEQFVNQHSFGLESSITSTTYPIKSLDLFIVHGARYNLIRFVHPKIIAMDHDVLAYEASGPIEIGMQFAYETVVYETFNYEMANAKNVTIDFDEIFANSRVMPTTPSIQTGMEGTNGTYEPNYDWNNLSTQLSNVQNSNSTGSGTTVVGSSTISKDKEEIGTTSKSVIASAGYNNGQGNSYSYSSADDARGGNNYVSTATSANNNNRLTKDENGNGTRND